MEFGLWKFSSQKGNQGKDASPFSCCQSGALLRECASWEERKTSPQVGQPWQWQEGARKAYSCGTVIGLLNFQAQHPEFKTLIWLSCISSAAQHIFFLISPSFQASPVKESLRAGSWFQALCSCGVTGLLDSQEWGPGFRILFWLGQISLLAGSGFLFFPVYLPQVPQTIPTVESDRAAGCEFRTLFPGAFPRWGAKPLSYCHGSGGQSHGAWLQTAKLECLKLQYKILSFSSHVGVFQQAFPHAAKVN